MEENNAAGAEVGTVEATDPDGDTLTYSLDLSQGRTRMFDISAGAITVTAANALDFEATRSYSLTVSGPRRQESRGQLGDSSVDAIIAVTVGVTNVLRTAGCARGRRR